MSLPTPELRADFQEDLIAAAATAARTGLVISLVVRRGGGLLTTARAAAEEVGVAVTADFTPSSMRLRFAPLAQAEAPVMGPSPQRRRRSSVHSAG